MDLAERLQPFVKAGLLRRVPTSFQVLQGTFEMTPYVLSTDVTAEAGYRPWLGHPLLRQPWLLREIGWDHFATGSGLRCKRESTIAHLMLTYHRGMPVFDLQLLQTHRDGLGALRTAIEESLSGHTRTGRRRQALARRFLRDPDDYFDAFLRSGGWIERAAAFDYPKPDEDGCAIPHEFHSLCSFLDHCAVSYPASPRGVGRRRVPMRLVWLGTRRFREVGGMGWFSVPA